MVGINEMGAGWEGRLVGRWRYFGSAGLQWEEEQEFRWEAEEGNSGGTLTTRLVTGTLCPPSYASNTEFDRLDALFSHLVYLLLNLFSISQQYIGRRAWKTVRLHQTADKG